MGSLTLGLTQGDGEGRWRIPGADDIVENRQGDLAIEQDRRQELIPEITLWTPHVPTFTY